MLRWLVLALLLANLAFWSWSQGWLRPLVGLGPVEQREASRLADQVMPESIRVLSAAAASAALAHAAQASQAATAGSAGNATPQAALQCLEAGPFSPAAVEAAEQVLVGALPARGWIRASREVTAQFVVFIGPLASRESLKAKSAELAALGLKVEELRVPGEREPGLALGRYDTRDMARAALDGFARRGVKTARVMTLRDAGLEWRLRVDNATAAQAEQLRALSLGGSAFAPCAS